MDPDQRAASRYPEDQHGRCATCGFCGVGRWYSVGDPEPPIGEVHPWSRQDGVAQVGNFRSYIVCFVSAADLYGEVEKVATELGHPNPNMAVPEAATDRLIVLNFDRHCEEWYPYTPGLSPKEHLEQRLLIDLEHARREHDLRLSEMEREGRRSSEQIQADSLAIARAVKGFTTRWTYAAFGVALAVLVVGIVTLVFTAISATHSTTVVVKAPAPTSVPKATPK